jgi:hypothetical protein
MIKQLQINFLDKRKGHEYIFQIDLRHVGDLF